MTVNSAIQAGIRSVAIRLEIPPEEFDPLLDIDARREVMVQLLSDGGRRDTFHIPHGDSPLKRKVEAEQKYFKSLSLRYRAVFSSAYEAKRRAVIRKWVKKNGEQLEPEQDQAIEIILKKEEQKPPKYDQDLWELKYVLTEEGSDRKQGYRNIASINEAIKARVKFTKQEYVQLWKDVMDSIELPDRIRDELYNLIQKALSEHPEANTHDWNEYYLKYYLSVGEYVLNQIMNNKHH